MRPIDQTLCCQRGTTMIEVLVTIVILTLGLLGLAGLQSRLQLSEVEAYQRSQALIVLQDMANRLATNRNNASAYAADGTEVTIDSSNCPTNNTTWAEKDIREWCLALKGAAERSAGNASVGAMLGARGCLKSLGSNEYLVTVAWQGLGPISSPPADVTCGAAGYDNGTTCTDDKCRRVLTTVVRFGTL